jgi:hypothetical protein
MSKTTKSKSSRPAYVPGEILFRVHPEMLPAGEASFDALPDELRSVLEYLEGRGLRSLSPYFHSGPRARRNEARLNRHARSIFQSVRAEEDKGRKDSRLAGTMYARFDSDVRLGFVLRRLSTSPAVDYAERVPARYLAARTAGGPRRSAAVMTNPRPRVTPHPQRGGRGGRGR